MTLVQAHPSHFFAEYNCSTQMRCFVALKILNANKFSIRFGTIFTKFVMEIKMFNFGLLYRQTCYLLLFEIRG